MRDRQLEKNIARVEGFIDEWKQLSQYLDRGFQGEPLSDEDEVGFLELKSRLAQHYEVMSTTLGADAERTDRTLRLLNLVPSLQSISEMEEGANRRLTAEWHSTYLGLQSLLGKLKGRRLQLATVNSFRLGMRHVFGHPLVIILVALAAGYGVYRFAEDTIPKLIELREKNR